MWQSEDSSKSTLPIDTAFYYGWIMVFVSALTRFFSGPGQTYSVSTFIDSYIQQFGWSRSMVSTMYSLGTLTAGLLMGVMGNLFDRKGHRIMTALVAIGLSLACGWMSVVQDPVMLVGGFFFLFECLVKELWGFRVRLSRYNGLCDEEGLC